MSSGAMFLAMLTLYALGGFLTGLLVGRRVALLYPLAGLLFVLYRIVFVPSDSPEYYAPFAALIGFLGIFLPALLLTLGGIALSRRV